MSKYAPSIPPFHLLVSEPELKWCEALIDRYRFRCGCGCCPERENFKSILMYYTNMSEIRVDRALNLLYYSKRI